MFIIVEVSMVSSLNLAYMHLRLEELLGGNEWFGATCSLLVTFSNYNLSMGCVMRLKKFPKNLSYKLGCQHVNIWRDCILYVELIINEQQKTKSFH